jgi:deoxyribonuclease-4
VTASTRPIGGHAFTVGGLAKGALAYLDQTGASAVQVYVSNPRAWALPPGSAEQDAAFRARCEADGVAVYVHACLLVNVGSPTPATVERSVDCLRHALRRGRDIGARGVVFHAGSAVDEAYRDRAMEQVRTALLPLLDEVGDRPRLLVEASAGGARCLARRVEDLGPYLAAVDRHPALGVCLDTCHAWAAGHDLAAPGGAASTVDALVAAVGADRLWLVHANDSKDGCGSGRDRHENLGRGRIPTTAFAQLLAHPALAAAPVIVETPNDDRAGHPADIALLRRLAAGGPGQRPAAASSGTRIASRNSRRTSTSRSSTPSRPGTSATRVAGPASN